MSERGKGETAIRQVVLEFADLGVSLAHLVEDCMRPNYDAEAIAEVLGVAVLRGTTDGSSAAPSFKMGRGQFRSPPLTVDDDFIIAVDDAALLIVESLTGHIRDPLGTSQPPSSVLIEKAVEKGLPRTALRHVAEGIAGDDKAKKALFAWGVVPKTTLERRDTQLSPQESERTGRIARLFVHARALGRPRRRVSS